MSRPPRLSTWLLRRVLEPRSRQLILDDLAEDYSERRRRLGRFAANRWYRGELLRSIRPSFAARTAPRIPPDRSRLMDNLFADLKQSARRLLGAPGFTAAAVLTLALGIGANAAIFTLVDGIVLRPLPFGAPDRLYSIQHSAPGLGVDEMEMSMGTYVHYLRNASLIESAGLVVMAGVNLTDDGPPERLQAASITASLLPTLGVEPLIGEAFSEEDDLVGTPSRVLLSHALWQQRYGGDPGVVGRTIRLQGTDREVIGVMPQGFGVPSPETAVYLPMKVPESEIRFGGFFRIGVVRLPEGATPEQLVAELQALIPSLADAYDVAPQMLEEAQVSILAKPLKQRIVGNIDRPLGILFGTVGFVLLIACANVANLFLVRSEGRNKEVAVRRALGASRRRLATLLLTEAGLLGAGGAALGLAIAWLGVRGVRLSGVQLPRIGEVGIDARVILFTGAVALIATVLFSALPALRLGRRDLETGLRDESRSTTSSRSANRARHLLVGAQMALALTLLVGSALMAQSSWRLAHVDPGHRVEGLLTAQVLLPGTDYPDDAASVEFYQEVAAGVASVPGVVSAAASSKLPLQPGMGRWDVLFVEGDNRDPDTLPPTVVFRYVTEGYFETMGIPLVEGRLFEPTDAAAGNAAAVVSQTLARERWPAGDAVGGVGWQENPDDLAGTPRARVVGVVGDTLDQDLAEDPTPIFYYPVLEGGADNLFWVPSQLEVIARTEGDPLAVADAVRKAIWSIDPNLPIANVRTIEGIIDASTLNTRFTMTLLVLAAAIALFLGAIGLYGTIAYIVGQRTREIGVRMALGAAGSDVARMVLRQGTVVAVAGLTVGLVTALGVSRFLDSLLFDVSATDPLTYVAMAALLLAVALAASYLPARRAGRLDPVEGLRAE